MYTYKGKVDYQELLSPDISKKPSRFLEILEEFDNSFPTRDSALIIKKAMGLHNDPVLSFLLKKSFRIAVFKLKGTKIKNSIAGLTKLLHSPDRLDDLALAISTVEKAEAFLAIDYLKEANWKEYPTEILPCFCIFFKNNGNSQDCEDLLELTRHPNPIVIAAAIEAIKKLDTGSLRSVLEPLINQKNTNSKEAEVIEHICASNINHDSSNIANESEEFFIENHQLLIDRLKDSNSDLETVRILRLFRKFGTEEDIPVVKPFLTKNKPDIVRAAIKVFEKLDKEYLSIYLPQLLQDKSPKIRLTAARVFQTIDKDSVIEVVQGFLSSNKPEQRNIGITTGLLADFEQVREQFLLAFAKETNSDLLEKLSLVIAANPDIQLVKDVYITCLETKGKVSQEHLSAIEMIAEKVSISLGGDPTGKELIENAISSAETLKSQKSKEELSEKNLNQTKSPVKSDYSIKKTNKSDAEAPKSVEPKSGFEKFWGSISPKGKTILVFIILGITLWGLLFATLLLRMFE